LKSTKRLKQSYQTLTPLSRSTFKLLILLTVGLVLIDITVYVWLKAAIAGEWLGTEQALRTLAGYIDTDIERSIPAWFNGGLWFVSSAVALLIAYARSSKTWMGFALICTGLSLDEIIGFHEGLGPVAQRLIGNQTGLLNFEWVIIGALLTVVLTAAAYQAVKTLDSNQRRLIFTAGVIFVIGALGFESLSGYAIENYGTQFFYHSMAWIEELLEMTGVSLLLATLVSVSGIDS